MKVYVLTLRRYGDFDVAYHEIVSTTTNKEVADAWKKRGPRFEFTRTSLDDASVLTRDFNFDDE